MKKFIFLCSDNAKLLAFVMEIQSLVERCVTVCFLFCFIASAAKRRREDEGDISKLSISKFKYIDPEAHKFLPLHFINSFLCIS